MMIRIIIFSVVILKIQLTLGQTSATKCTSSSLTSCAYNEIRCPPNYFFNGQYCLPIQATAAPTQQTRPTQLPETKCTPRPPVTLLPTNPDPLPVKPVCEAFYEWNGQECYKVLSNEANCPLGHNLTASGHCVSVVQALCQENYYVYGDFCVGLVEAPVVCPDNYYWDGKVCVYQIVASCPDGFVLNNGYCEIFNEGSCPKGTLMDNSKCIGHHQIKIQCEFGYIWNGNLQICEHITNSCEEGFELRDNVCKKNITRSPDFECPPRTQMVGSQCVSVELVCPKGFTLIDSVCVEQISSINSTESFIVPNCTTGYQLVGCECVKVNETTPIPTTEIPPTSPTPICPPNYVYKDGLCHFQQDNRPPICPIDYEIRNGKCEPIRPEKCPPRHKLIDGVCVLEIEPTQPTNCPDGHILIQGFCIPLPKCPHIECQTNYTSSCICPVGYNLVNGLCVISPNVCPTGYQLINGICILTTQPGSKPCPPDTQPTNGNCQIPNNPEDRVCPPGYQKVDGKCVLVETPDIDPCPTGYQWKNGTCVFTYPETNVCSPGYHWVDGNCTPIESENPHFNPCPTGYRWSNGACVKLDNPSLKVCPDGYFWVNGTCVDSTIVVPNKPDKPGEGEVNPPDNTTPPTLPPVVQPCYQPCKPCPTINPPCQPCQPNNGPNPVSEPLKPPSGCPNCPIVTNYITKDGHISITNIVNVAHHHQRTPSKPVDIPASDNIEESIDYDTTGQNATDEGDAAKKCCEIITPRQCERKGDEWNCFHRKYQRCGDVCTQPKIYLKPKMIRYQPPILIMPPPPRRIYGRRRKFGGGAVDCSGCIHGGYRCSVECYNYPDCSWSNCAYVDQDIYCEEWDHNETEGCSTYDGYYE